MDPLGRNEGVGDDENGARENGCHLASLASTDEDHDSQAPPGRVQNDLSAGQSEWVA